MSDTGLLLSLDSSGVNANAGLPPLPLIEDWVQSDTGRIKERPVIVSRLRWGFDDNLLGPVNRRAPN